MEQKADHREHIYRKNGDDTWGRRLTTESKSIGKLGTTLGAEGCDKEVPEEEERRRGEEEDSLLNHKTTHRGSGIKGTQTGHIPGYYRKERQTP